MRDAKPAAGCYEYISAQGNEKDSGFEDLPNKTSLECYNDVFNPTKGQKGLIKVELQKQTYVKLGLYNSSGNSIKKMVYEKMEARIYKYYWDGKDGNGNIVGSGIYFVHLEAGDYKRTRKIIVVK